MRAWASDREHADGGRILSLAQLALGVSRRRARGGHRGAARRDAAHTAGGCGRGLQIGRTPMGVESFLSLNSPWAYLGAERVVAIAARHGATLRIRPVDAGVVF